MNMSVIFQQENSWRQFRFTSKKRVRVSNDAWLRIMFLIQLQSNMSEEVQQDDAQNQSNVWLRSRRGGI